MFLAHWKRAILAHPRPLLALFLGVLVPLWVFGSLINLACGSNLRGRQAGWSVRTRRTLD